MQRSVLEYLESTVELFPEKMAFADDKKSVTFKELYETSQRIASYLVHLEKVKNPIVVYMPKGCDCISAFMGIAASGNFYCPIDSMMPIERINIILNELDPIAIITTTKMEAKAKQLVHNGELIIFDEIINTEILTEKLKNVQEEIIDTDPLYVLFTSGSTGVPKGVVIAHRSVIDYIDWVTESFCISSGDTFGNQAPFYFDNSVLDIYCALKNGSSVYIIPKRKFSFSIDLFEYLNEKHINAVFWVPSVLCMAVNTNAFSVLKPQYLKKILFAGEVMPNKHLNVWRKNIPDALYANLYGPTEITVDCTYYIVEREFSDDESLPIGKACANSRVIVLNENDELVKVDEEGELCVLGSSLALGYYNNPMKTAEVFVQNPLNSAYIELMYRTGDIVKYNAKGEILYLSRKDYQIKHMGYRVELGEIENAALAFEGIENCICIYEQEKDNIVLCYTGRDVDESLLSNILVKKLPTYMLPGKYVFFEEFAYTQNGKVDRKKIIDKLK